MKGRREGDVVVRNAPVLYRTAGDGQTKNFDRRVALVAGMQGDVVDGRL